MQPSGHTQRLAGRIADAIARGRPLQPSPALEAFLASPSGEIYAVLDAFERHLAAGTERTHDLAEAYLHLLQLRLEHLRYDADSNYDWAKAEVKEFQRTVAQHVRDGRLDGTGLAAIGRALREAKLEAIPELIDAGGAHVETLPQGMGQDLPREAERLMSGLIEAAGGDPFALCEAMAEGGFTLPPEARSATAALLLHRPEAAAQEAAALTMLDPSPEARRAIALALQANAGRLSPTSLRRLIALRNWLPESEHHLVDQVVRAARVGGIDCAHYASTQPATIQASGLDGAGAQGFLIVSPEGKRWRPSSVVVKRGKGIKDAWCGEAQSKGALRRNLGAAGAEAVARPVERKYLDLAVRHHLVIGGKAGALPPAGLLQLAEILGGPDWQPDELDWRSALGALIDDVPAAERTEAAVARTLAFSTVWSEVGVGESWFEEDQEVADLVARARKRNLERLSDYLLRAVVVRRAEKWAEHFAWVALWLRHALPVDANWRNFAVLARAIAQERGVADIPIMRAIAARSAVAAQFTGSPQVARSR